jgi:hypothetical protein
VSGGVGGVGGGHSGGAAGRADLAAGGKLRGYDDNWIERTKTTLEADLRARGIESQTALEDKAMQKPCNCGVHIFITVLICTIIFGVIWELT